MSIRELFSAGFVYLAAFGSDTFANEYRASMVDQEVVVEERGQKDWAKVFHAVCENTKKHANGASFKCISDDGKAGNLASLNLQTLRGSLLVKVDSINPKSRTPFACDVEESSAHLINCKVSGGRKVPGRLGLVSPFASEAPGVDLPNARWLREPNGSSGGGVLRGMEPRIDSDFEQLVTVSGITRVLIFKEFSDSAADALTREEEGFKRFGKDKVRIQHVKFPYFGFPSYKEACEMTVDALTILEEVRRSGENIFFHCTVGEDRTGYLAALYQLLADQRRSVRRVFEDEMCEHGYERGNPFKPANVTANIKNDLTPLFLFMAEAIKDKAIFSDGTLSNTICSKANSEVPKFRDQTRSCTLSTKFFLQPL